MRPLCYILHTRQTLDIGPNLFNLTRNYVLNMQQIKKSQQCPSIYLTKKLL